MCVYFSQRILTSLFLTFFFQVVWTIICLNFSISTGAEINLLWISTIFEKLSTVLKKNILNIEFHKSYWFLVNSFNKIDFNILVDQVSAHSCIFDWLLFHKFSKSLSGQQHAFIFLFFWYCEHFIYTFYRLECLA